MLRIARLFGTAATAHPATPTTNPTTNHVPLEIPLSSTRLSITHADVATPLVRTTCNGVDVVAQGPRLPVASLCLRLPAGSSLERHFSIDDGGVSLVYQHALFTTTAFATPVFVTRYCEENGVRLRVERDRQSVNIYADAPQGALEGLSELLLKTVTTVNVKKGHEFPKVVDSAKLEALMARADPRRMLMDLVFRTAYDRDALGNSLWVAEAELEQVEAESVQRFGNLVLQQPKGHQFTGVGVDPHHFTNLFKTHGYSLSSATTTTTKATKTNKRTGQHEQYTQNTHSFPHDHVALFWRCSGKDRNAVDLFKSVFAVDSKVPFGARRGPLADLHVFEDIKPFSEIYGDHGLFGLSFAIDRNTADYTRVAGALKCAIKAVVGGPSQEAIDFGRAALKMSHFDQMTAQYSRIRWASSPIVELLDPQKVELIKVDPNKVGMVAIGDAYRLPRLDDIL